MNVPRVKRQGRERRHWRSEQDERRRRGGRHCKHRRTAEREDKQRQAVRGVAQQAENMNRSSHASSGDADCRRRQRPVVRLRFSAGTCHWAISSAGAAWPSRVSVAI